MRIARAGGARISPTGMFLAMAAVFCGCGVASDRPSGGSLLGDGVSGFGEASLIEICLKTARVVPPSEASAAGGVCVRDGSVGAPCDGDAVCSGIERCICGRCIVEACQGAASCGEGRVCRGRRCTTSCAEEGDCGAGQRCISGGCARACSGDGECHFGERCDALDSACAVKLCGGALACGPGDTCEAEQVVGEVREPSIVTVSGERLAFFEIRSGAEAAVESAIYRARIDTPERWTADPAAPVLAPPEGETRAGAPSAIVRGDRVELYFAVGAGSRIGRAISIDEGVTFAEDTGWIFEPSEAWEAGFIGSPSVFEHGGVTYLFYEGGPRAGIGLARVDAAAAERLTTEPVVTPKAVVDPVLWRGITEVGAPHALAVDGVVRLYFTGRGVEGGDALSGGAALPADRNDSIGLLTTRDLATFSRYPVGPVFARVTNLRAYLGEREAVVDRLHEGAEIIFLASDASGSRVSGFARATSR